MSFHKGSRYLRLAAGVLALLLMLCQDGTGALSVRGAEQLGPATSPRGGPATSPRGGPATSPRGGRFLLQDAVGLPSASVIRVPQDYASIQEAVNAAQDGDLVLVSPGTYAENIVLSAKAVTLASEFHTRQEPGLIEGTIIDGSGDIAITVDASVAPSTRITGFTIRNGSDGISASGELEILHNRFSGNVDAIDYEGGGGICRNNLFEDNRDDAIDLDGATRAIIENNVIRNNGDDGIEIRLHAYTGPVLNIIIRNNTITGNGEDGIQLIDYPDLSDRFILIERNLVQGNAMAGLGLMDKGDTTEDYRAASIPERIHVYNNTFSGNDHGLTGGDNLIALNNLFLDSITLATKRLDGDSIAAYNLYWNNGRDDVGSNLDPATTLFADPLLDSEFRPQPDSPAIDAGAAFFQWQGETVLDLPASQYRGAAPDLGAVEGGFVIYLPLIVRNLGVPIPARIPIWLPGQF